RYDVGVDQSGCDRIVGDQGVEQLVVIRSQSNPNVDINALALRLCYVKANNNVVVGDCSVLQGVTGGREVEKDSAIRAGGHAGDCVAGNRQMVPGVPRERGEAGLCVVTAGE